MHARSTLRQCTNARLTVAIYRNRQARQNDLVLSKNTIWQFLHVNDYLAVSKVAVLEDSWQTTLTNRLKILCLFSQQPSAIARYKSSS